MTLPATPVRVLAIDDDLADLELLRRTLERMGDPPVRVKTYHLPEEGIAEIAQCPPDVVLLDFQLGPVTALEVFERIRTLAPGVPVIVLTGRGDEETAARVMRAGIADYLPKDKVKAESLRRSIVNVLEKHRLRRDLERTVRNLRLRNEEIRGFYHVLSHELRTPLTSAREYVSMVLDGLAGPVNEEQQEFLGTAKRSCDQLVRFLNDLLDVTRMETGKLALDREERPVEPILQHVVAGFAPKAHRQEIDLRAETAPGLPLLFVDEGRIVQVLSNLVGNALKFTPLGGTITLSATRDAATAGVRISVTDTGRGIERERIPRVFDRLYQARDSDREIRGGLGLGLHICRELIRGHGGEIDVESEVGRGSTFTFVLPAHRIRAKEEAARVERG